MSTLVPSCAFFALSVIVVACGGRSSIVDELEPAGIGASGGTSASGGDGGSAGISWSGGQSGSGGIAGTGGAGARGGQAGDGGKGGSAGAGGRIGRSDCRWRGATFRDGESWPGDACSFDCGCEECWCKDGEVACEMPSCPGPSLWEQCRETGLPVSPECTECTCDQCAREWVDCTHDADCLMLVDCALATGCRDLGCYSPDTCMDLVDALGGPAGRAATLALSLGNCQTDAGCYDVCEQARCDSLGHDPLACPDYQPFLWRCMESSTPPIGVEPCVGIPVAGGVAYCCMDG